MPLLVTHIPYGESWEPRPPITVDNGTRIDLMRNNIGDTALICYVGADGDYAEIRYMYCKRYNQVRLTQAGIMTHSVYNASLRDGRLSGMVRFELIRLGEPDNDLLVQSDPHRSPFELLRAAVGADDEPFESFPGARTLVQMINTTRRLEEGDQRIEIIN